MYLFTSEVVSAGHPDKCADIIADFIVDEYIINDSNSRVATEVFVAGKNVIIGGEVKSKHKLSYDDYKNLVIKALKSIGYKNNDYFTTKQCLDINDINVEVYVNEQSPEISQGVDQNSGEIGAGDQGIMFGFACNETKNMMPSAITYARILSDRVYAYALKNPHEFGVDIKTQVSVDYEKKENFEQCNPKSIHTIVVSAPSVDSMSLDKVRKIITSIVIDANLPNFDKDKCILHINPTGKYTNHSALHDSGLTGRKLIVDTFGGYSPIGGGAQSSKDYTKVDRSALYAARWLAKHIVASGLAKKAIMQISYAIGVAKPISVCVDTMGTWNKLNDDELSKLISDKFSLTPMWIIKQFNLDKPSKDNFLYADVAGRGQVGQDDYPWEQLTEIEWFKKL